METKNSIHDHPLILKDELKKDGKKVDCYGCRKQITSGPIYCCCECNIILHKTCAELPLQITHAMHSEHTLLLVDNGFPSISLPKVKTDCFSCHMGTNGGFNYRCSPCNFNLCIDCVSTEHIIKHNSHQHPLMLLARQASIHCDACDQKGYDHHDYASYLCSVCPFWIHKTCASLPVTKKIEQHDHPLSLAYNVPLEFRHYQLNCDMCSQTLEPLRWVYFCGRCRFFVHIKCKKSRRERLRSHRSSSDAVQVSHLIKLPWKDVSVEVIRPFVEKNSQRDMQLVEEIKHFSHDHPLILSSLEINNEKNDEQVLCDGCVGPISSPYYSCVQCGFLLHIACANLPTQLQHPLHPEHPLFLRKLKHEFGYLYCTSCHARSNGFFFECEGCHFQLDLNCAILPKVIVHEAHSQHSLFQKVINKPITMPCNACGRKMSGLAYICYSTDKNCTGFRLHYECAILPHGIWHRWDKHRLILMYPPFGDHPDEFYCEICEEEIHPKHWMYHCRTCDQSFHIFCIPQLGQDRYIKFGYTIRVDDHQHLLMSVREGKFRSKCARCDNELSSQKAFECEPCRFSLCYKCACKIPDEPCESGLLPGQENESDTKCIVM